VLEGEAFFIMAEIEAAVKTLAKTHEIVYCQSLDLPMIGLMPVPRLIVLDHLEEYKKKDLEAFVLNCNTMLESGLDCFVFCSRGQKTPEPLKTLKYEIRHVYEPLKPWEMAKWMVWCATTRHHVQLSENYAQVILLNIGSDLILLDRELYKVAVYLESQGQKEVTVEAITSLMVPHEEMKPFVMLDAFGKGDMALAVRIFDRISITAAEDAVLGWVSLTLRHIETLLTALAYKEEGKDVVSAMGWHRSAEQRWMPQVYKSNQQKLCRAFMSLTQLQRRLLMMKHKKTAFLLWLLSTEHA
jgi:DNA polymerase III delta subunit